MSVIPAIQSKILEEKLALWQNTQFASECDIKLAGIIEDEKMKEEATANLRKCIRAIETLQKMIGELPEEKGNGV